MEDSKDQILKQEMPLAFTRVEESSSLLVGATQMFKNDPTSPEGRKKLLDGARGKVFKEGVTFLLSPNALESCPCLPWKISFELPKMHQLPLVMYLRA